MSTYYEQLSISPEADAAEIEGAIDRLYNQWRLSVTHPDATIVEEANRNLRVLEQMRATLTDPVKRAGYDAGIGLGGAGGLADPTAMMRQAAPLSPRPKNTAGQANDRAASVLWACPKCATDNPPQTKHCFNCGAQLVRMCPNCDQMTSLVASGFCGNCGANYDVAAQIAELRVAREATNAQTSQARSAADRATAQLNGLEKPRPRIILVLLGAIVSGLALRWGLTLFEVTHGSSLPIAIAYGFFYVMLGLGMYGWKKKAYDKANSGLQNDLAVKQLELNRASEHLAAIESELELLERKLKP